MVRRGGGIAGRGTRIPGGPVRPGDPEKIRGAKEWLGQRKTDGRPYKPTVDQGPLTSAFDMALARAGSPSFGKLCRDVQSLLADGSASEFIA